MPTEQDQGKLLRSFVGVSLQLAQDLDLETVLTTIVERSMEVTGASYGAVVTLSGASLENLHHRGFTAEQAALLPDLAKSRGVLGEVLEQGRTVRSEKLGVHLSDDAFPREPEPLDAFLGVPLAHRDTVVGALYLAKPEGSSPFTPYDEELVKGMASMAAVEIANARLYLAERQRAERGALLSEIAWKVRHSLDVAEVLSATVETLGRAAKVDRCFIQLSSDTEDGLPLGPVEYEWDATGMASLQDQQNVRFPVSALAAKARKTRWSDDITSDDRLRDPELPGLQDALYQDVSAVLATPLLWGDSLLGVVAFHTRSPRPWTSADVALIEAAGREVANALHHANIYSAAVETAERLKELDKLRSDFVSMVSHELRSPMTVIGGIADILRKGEQNIGSTERLKLVETLAREAKRLTRLVSNVLDVEAAENRGFSLDLGEVELGQLARESVVDSGLSGRVTVDVGEGATTSSVDRDKIKQVLLNLINNAVKFSDGDAPVEVRVIPSDGEVRVEVTDKGPGISEDDRPRMFQRFSRLSPRDKRKPGSGLGLYLSRLIVEQHGGRIGVESVPGEGSTFVFRLPTA